MEKQRDSAAADLDAHPMGRLAAAATRLAAVIDQKIAGGPVESNP